eukprot:3967086-Prymnesium_polylepis.2
MGRGIHMGIQSGVGGRVADGAKEGMKLRAARLWPSAPPQSFQRPRALSAPVPWRARRPGQHRAPAAAATRLSCPRELGRQRAPAGARRSRHRRSTPIPPRPCAP